MAGGSRFSRLRSGSWSPFARPEGSSEEAAAEAILRAVEHEGCAIDELTPDRYSRIRRANPELGLPRAIVLRRVCGGWRPALEAAEERAAALARQATV